MKHPRPLKKLLALFILSALSVTLAPVTGAQARFQGKGKGFEFTFSGLETVSRRQLLDAAQRALNPFGSGEGTPADIADAAYSMELWLRQQGLARASVRFRYFNTAGGGKTYFDTDRNWAASNGAEFIVSEGRQYYISDISFTGIRAYDSAYLRQFFNFPRPGFLNTGRPLYLASDVDTGISRIEELYLLAGYYDVVIGTTETDFKEDGTVDITVPVSEGPLYQLSRQTIQSDTLNPTQINELRKSLPETGQPYYIRLAAEGATNIRNTLGDWGYRATVDYSVSLDRIDQNTGKASVTYTVDPGKPLILSDYRIINEGEAPLRTQRALITSRFPLDEGDTIDRRRLNLGLSRLYGLGIFSTIDVAVVPEDTPADNPLQPAAIEIHLTESETRFMGVTLGWGTYELLRGSVRYTDLNLFGTGRVWETDLSGNFKGYQVSTSLRDNILFGPASLLGINASYRYSIEPSFTVTEGDASISFSYDISPFWNLKSSYTYSLSKVTNNTGAIAGAENDLLSTGRVNFVSQIDTRQSTLLPDRGGYLSSGVTYSSRFLGSERDFLHYTFRGAAYYPLIKRMVLALAFGYETKQILDDIPTLPIQERLFLGGGGSVRSFGQDRLSPVGEEGKPIGGLTAALASLELRIRVWRQLHLALFSDAGSVQESSFSFDGPIGWALGAGLRYYLPVGPIRLDFAWNPGPLFADTNSWQINFAVGFSF